ncbi:MAG: protein translocase subunit SecD [Synechococcaceae cyanobacterium RL_1_2]|nr:protein translocase subunit SecD [Synechococcaceae cyanobacterium RL_1_2]
MRKQQALIVLILVLAIAAITTLVKLPLELGLDLKGGAQLTIQVKPTEEITTISQENLDGVKSVIENRINGLGVAEPVIQTVGEDKISVQLAGVTDPEQAEKVLGGTAQLEFREQKPDTETQLNAERQIRFQKQLELLALQQSKTPDLQAQEKVLASIEESKQAILDLFASRDLMGSNLKSARPQPNASGQGWEVQIVFDQEGGEKFAELTKNIAGTGRSIGVFLDNELISAPVVGIEFANTGISGGSAVITGNFDVETSNTLAVQIRGGSLPFPVEVVENRTVGATLGQDSIRKSIIAGIGGLVLVLIFVVLYYRLPGVIADIALIIYTLFTLACYSLIGVTMTLPGIAGFILSIGMAVDANVLIFERTREELRGGNSLYRSVEAGFNQAFSSILDSNVTTLIACGALFWLGSGLVKGFALTLAIGVAVSMFTALTCSRTLLLFVVLNSAAVRRKPELFLPNLASTRAE